MKYAAVLPLPLISFITLISSCALFKPQAKVVGTVPLATVFGQVVDQFQQAEGIIKATDIGKHTIKITNADVVFDNVVTNAQNASLSLLIFRGGYNRSERKETTVTYSLQAVPEAMAHSRVLPRTQGKNQNALKDLIVSSFNQFIAVSVPKEAGNFAKSISITIAFTVDQYGNVEVAGPIRTVNADASLSRDIANTHTVSISFSID